ncbi:uncharacterized protein LOC129219456 [Uloborus diversus]|uniref:uncharacterized protein LOC129219456 n=1 Tax=Uloborus diversus TaxID=327109 RepID=UPI002409D7D2|nr:uncharacterized protein LOC129219456 [Uloborus diversus]
MEIGFFEFDILASPESNGKVAFIGSTMKQPRLPGAEKFRFSTCERIPSSTNLTVTNPRRLSSISQTSETDSSSHFIYQSRSSPNGSQGEISSITSFPTLIRTESKRRAVLPITCKKTSRMLNNTNLELNVNHADLVSEDSVKLKRLDSIRVPSCPNLETSNRSLNSSKSSLDTYFRKMSLQNSTIRETPCNFDWKNIRASPSRLSASCSSSCSSEENVWVLREDS